MAVYSSITPKVNTLQKKKSSQTTYNMGYDPKLNRSAYSNIPGEVRTGPDGKPSIFMGSSSSKVNLNKNKTGSVYSASGTQSTDTRTEAQKAFDEAKKETLAGRDRALGYLDSAGTRADTREKVIQDIYGEQKASYDDLSQKIADMPDYLIDPTLKNKIMNERADQLAVSAQNIASVYGDSDAGIQKGIRRNIAFNTAVQQSNIPLDTELNVASQNRQALLEKINAQKGLADSKSNIDASQIYNLLQLSSADKALAGAKAGVETSYEYDPGADYFFQAGKAEGQLGGYSSPYAGLSFSTNKGGSSKTDKEKKTKMKSHNVKLQTPKPWSSGAYDA